MEQEQEHGTIEIHIRTAKLVQLFCPSPGCTKTKQVELLSYEPKDTTRIGLTCPEHSEKGSGDQTRYYAADGTELIEGESPVVAPLPPDPKYIVIRRFEDIARLGTMPLPDTITLPESYPAIMRQTCDDLAYDVEFETIESLQEQLTLLQEAKKLTDHEIRHGEVYRDSPAGAEGRALTKEEMDALRQEEHRIAMFNLQHSK